MSVIKKPVRILSLLLAGTLLMAAACARNPHPEGFSANSAEPLAWNGADYSKKDNWLCFGGGKRKGVDIFMIYPTITVSKEKADLPYVRLDSEPMRTAAAEWLSATQGLAVESANIYAPFYRQLNGAMLESLNNDTFMSYTNAIPRDDIFAAFAYYLKEINKGERPFILLGHSQGAQLVTELATTFLGNASYQKYNTNLIIAYAIGVSVTKDQMAANPAIRFSAAKDDTRTLVSWNTTAPSEIATGKYTIFGTWRPGALVTNPITWLTNETLAHASDNTGSLIIQPDGTTKMVAQQVNAIADKEHSVLVTTTVDESQHTIESTKVSKFHRYDITFYYDSIKRNIQDRIKAFTAQ